MTPLAAKLSELAQVRAVLAKRDALSRPQSFMAQKPTPRQAEFLALTQLEALYGGAAGGGKSSALLLAALQYAHVPGYAALILRRTFADLNLPGAIMDRAKEWLVPRGVSWNQTDKRFTFPSGATLTFGYLDTAADRYRYQGSEIQFLGVDELTQWQESNYRYLLSRIRKATTLDVPLRARAASNPGGVGHDWVYRRFVDPDTNEARPFVPALLSDNPHLDENYSKSLDQLSPVERAQLRDGQWVRDSEGLVYPFDDQLVLVDSLPPCDYTILGCDFGVVDDCAFVVWGWRAHDKSTYVLAAEKWPGLTTTEAAAKVQALIDTFQPVTVLGDVGGLGKVFANDLRERFAIPIEPALKTNKRGYISLMVDALRQGRIKVHRVLGQELIKEWRDLVWAEGREKEHPGCANHLADAGLYGWRGSLAWTTDPKEEAPKPGTNAFYDDLQTRLEEQAERETDEWAA